MGAAARPLSRLGAFGGGLGLMGVALALLLTAWVFATPPLGSPDEGAHMIKAAAVAHGVLLGDTSITVNGTGGEVRAPQDLSRLQDNGLCFAAQAGRPANCALDMGDSSAVVPTFTAAARYFPLYYGIVGLPTLLLHGLAGFYAMRLVSAALNLVMLLLAFASARRRANAAWVVTGVLVALTPMAVYLGASINPNGLEITSAVTLWVSLLAALDPSQATDRATIGRAGVAAVVLCAMRSLSPLWLVLITAVSLITANRERVVELVRRRDVRLWGAAAIVTAAAQAGWTVWAHALQLGHTAVAPMSLPSIVVAAFGSVPGVIDQMIALFGWADTPALPFTYSIWYGLVGLVVLLSLAAVRGRRALQVVAAIAVSVLVPVAIEVDDYHAVGLIWQGRYSLPLTAGVMISAGYALATSPGAVPWLRRAVTVVAGFAAAAQLGGFWNALLRNTLGLGHGLNPLRGPWQPPGGTLLVLVLFVLGIVAYVVAARGLGRTATTPVAPAVSAGGEVPERRETVPLEA